MRLSWPEHLQTARMLELSGDDQRGTALALMGMMGEEVRLPLVSSSPATRDLIRKTLVEAGLLRASAAR